ncbi:MAG: hypothetical protein WBN55_05455 [Eudoraea sp.]|uniref:hypothetical protein n=2 Tax=Eudoraea sp. TaxID=1979955 RepID=UPI003C782B88
MEAIILPYSNEYHNDIKLLDDKSVQGNLIQLRMHKPTIHSRAEIFKEYFTILTKVKDEVVGFMSGAKTLLVINDKKHDVFIGFDAKVREDHRNRGIFKSMITYMMDYYSEQDVMNAIITTKSNNKSINSIVRKQFVKSWYRKFVYLTIPTSRKVNAIRSGKEPSLFIDSFEDKKRQDLAYSRYFKGFDIFNTYKTYQLEILQIPYLLKKGIQLVNKFYSKPRYPDGSKSMKIATLYKVMDLELKELNIAMEILHSEGIDFLNICCSEGDYLYNTFKPISISRYDYYLVSTLKLTEQDQIKLDVRCL